MKVEIVAIGKSGSADIDSSATPDIRRAIDEVLRKTL